MTGSVVRVLWVAALGLALASVVEAADRRFDLEIRERSVVSGDTVIRVSKGDRVQLAWTTDERVSLHLHGYDIEFEVAPGRPAVQTFDAHATGRFPVTSHGFGGEHGGHHTLLYFEVHPD